MSTTDALTAQAAAALPAAVRAAAAAWAPLTAALDDDDGGDPLRVVRAFAGARDAVDAAALDLLLVAVLAGARPTPTAVQCGYSAATLRRRLRALTAGTAV